MLHKRGLSAIVATVLIILLTVAAVGLVWGVILPLVRDSLGKATVCSDVSTSLFVESGSLTCKNNTHFFVEVSRGSSIYELVELTLLPSIDGSSYAKVLRDNPSAQNKSLPLPNEVRSFYFVKGSGSSDFELDLGSKSISGIDSVGISAVVLDDDGVELRCNIEQVVSVPFC